MNTMLLEIEEVNVNEEVKEVNFEERANEEVIRRNLQNYKKEKAKQFSGNIDFASIIGETLAKHFPYSIRYGVTKNGQTKYGFGELNNQKESFSFPVSDETMSFLMEENHKKEERALRKKANLYMRRREFDALKLERQKKEKEVIERRQLEAKRRSVCGEFLDIPLSVAKVG